MHTSSKTSVLVGLTLAFLLLPTAGSAQKSGFFFRGNVGAGYASIAADDAADTKMTGGSGMVTLSFGKFVRSNVAIYGEIFGTTLTGPTLESGGNTVSTSSDLTASVGGVGFGATVYSRSGVYFGGTVGVASMSMEYDTGAISVEGSSDPGLGLSFLVGKEWKVGNKWGLGVSGHAITGMIPDDGANWTPMAVGVDFTFTYVGGGYN